MDHCEIDSEVFAVEVKQGGSDLGITTKRPQDMLIGTQIYAYDNDFVEGWGTDRGTYNTGATYILLLRHERGNE